MRRRKVILGSNNFSLIEPDETKRHSTFKRPQRLCTNCKRGYTTTQLNTFSKINKICGECKYNPIAHPQYRKNCNLPKEQVEDLSDKETDNQK